MQTVIAFRPGLAMRCRLMIGLVARVDLRRGGCERTPKLLTAPDEVVDHTCECAWQRRLPSFDDLGQQFDTPPAYVAVAELRHRLKQALGIGMARMQNQGLQGARVPDVARLEDVHAIGDRID
jgi:hypothetical protein